MITILDINIFLKGSKVTYVYTCFAPETSKSGHVCEFLNFNILVQEYKTQKTKQAFIIKICNTILMQYPGFYIFRNIGILDRSVSALKRKIAGFFSSLTHQPPTTSFTPTRKTTTKTNLPKTGIWQM